MWHQLNYLFNGHSLAAFLFVETFIKMNSRGKVDNSCANHEFLHVMETGVSLTSVLEIKSERYLKKCDFLLGFLKSEDFIIVPKITCMHNFIVMVKYICCKVYNVCKA